VLPAVTLDVVTTDEGMQQMSAQLTAFAHDHGLPRPVGSRMLSVANDVARLVSRALAPPVTRLQADADIGPADTQLVIIAGDERLSDVYASLRQDLELLEPRCDGFAAELVRGAELEVWARFRLAGAGDR
jgi:hypothetical protein